MVIAELLDHTDTQNVRVYTANTPEIAERINRAIAFEMALLANFFLGKVIDDESQATRADDPNSRIRDFRIDKDGSPLGSCGQHSPCHFSRPIACYTCMCFEPWLDGAHGLVLEFLLARREKSTASTRVKSINDKTIIAVARVIMICEEKQAERKHG